MFTKKPEPGESGTKIGDRPGGGQDAKSSPFTERPATFNKGASSAPSPSFCESWLLKGKPPTCFWAIMFWRTCPTSMILSPG